MDSILLTLAQERSSGDLEYQRLIMSPEAPDRMLHPAALHTLEWPDTWESGRPAVLDGRVPNWVHAYAALRVAEMHEVPWIGIFEPRDNTAIRIHPPAGAGEAVSLGRPETGPAHTGRISLSVDHIRTVNGSFYQRLVMDLDGKITPRVLAGLRLPPELNPDEGVIIFGSGPLWLYACMALRCREAPWAGVFNIQSGGYIVVASRTREARVGDFLRVAGPKTGSAILIGGPPESGKTALCGSLDVELRRRLGERVHLHRAQVDGEGDWYNDMAARPESAERARELRGRARGKYSDRFFFYQANVVANAREVVDILLVDFGGKPDEKDAALLHRCSHYIVISRHPAAVADWHDFCGLRGGLKCLAVIHSVLDDKLEILRTEPYLEVIAGPWKRGQTTLPETIVEQVLGLLPPLTRI